MTQLQVRRMRFDFDETVPFIWNPSNPLFSMMTNMISMIAICFEKFVVEATREAQPFITDPEAASEADAFLRQEGQHANAHRQHLKALIAQYPGLQQTMDATVEHYDKLTKSASLAHRLAYVADLEASFTPTFKLMLDHEETLFRPGDERVASLLLWHFVEEVEHRSSALVVYNAVVPSKVYRLRVLPSVLKHLGGMLKIVVNGFNEHVPAEDRAGIDARILLPGFGAKVALKQKLPFLHYDGPDVPPPYGDASKKEQRAATLGILMSQNPKHDPEHQPLPVFADEWLRRYAAEEDVVSWYSSQKVS